MLRGTVDFIPSQVLGQGLSPYSKASLRRLNIEDTVEHIFQYEL